MLRFILRQKSKEAGGSETVGYYTFPLDAPMLQAELSRGGYGEDGYTVTELVGVEVVDEDPVPIELSPLSEEEKQPLPD
jgi:hypothetical protein